MRVPDCPGGAPEGLLGGLKIVGIQSCLYGFHVSHASCVIAYVLGAWWRWCLATSCSVNAAWAPGGLHEGPGWLRGGPGGAA